MNTDIPNDEFIPPSLNIFQKPPTACGIQNVQWIDYRPVSQVGENLPIEFSIPGSGSAYIDLSRTYLQFRARILKSGQLLPNGEGVAPVNLWMHSLFSQCDVTLQQKLLYNSGRMYPYKAYIETILDYTEDKGNRLQTEMYYKDSPGSLESYNVNEKTAVNAGLLERYERIRGSKWCDMIGRLHGDLCQLDRLLLNGVSIGIKLQPASMAFHLMSGSANTSVYKVELDSITLKVAKVQVENEIFSAHSNILSRGLTAKYPVNKTELSTYVVSKGSTLWTQTDVFQNRIPTILVIGLVSSQAYQGDFTKNPFGFHGYNLKALTVTKDGQIHPFRPIRTNFNTGECTEAYNLLFKDNTVGSGITLADFKHGTALYIYRTDDQFYDFNCQPTSKQGNISIEGDFHDPLPENVNVIIYAQFNGLIEIDQYRTVTA